MIRFRCKCGKKLKADESIVGRKVRCTQCDRVNRVPAESTAMPSKKGTSAAAGSPVQQAASVLVLDDRDDSQDQVSLLPDHPSQIHDNVDPPSPGFDREHNDDPDEEIIGGSEGSYDFDFESIDFNNPKVADESLVIDTTRVTETVSKESGKSKRTPSSSSATPSRKRSLEIPWGPLLWVGGGIVAIAGACGLIYLAFLLIGGAASYPEEFEQLTEVKHYRYCLAQYQKSERIMTAMAKGYLASERPGDATTKQIEGYLEKVSSFAHSDQTLQQALELHQQGDSSGVRKLLSKEAKRLQAKRPEYETKAREYVELTR